VPQFPDENALIAEGAGSYGPVSLWRLTNGRFELRGLDEHNKPYLFEWSGCASVGEIRPTPTVMPDPATCDNSGRRSRRSYSGQNDYASGNRRGPCEYVDSD